MRYKSFVVAIFGLATATAVAAQGVPTAAPAAPDKKVCRREAQTGSILGSKRVCHSAAEWAQIDAANAANTEAFSRARNTGGRNN